MSLRRLQWAQLTLAMLTYVHAACDFRSIDVSSIRSGASITELLEADEPVLLRNSFYFVEGAADRTAFLELFGHHRVVVAHNLEEQSRTGWKQAAERMSVNDWVKTWVHRNATRYAFTWLKPAVGDEVTPGDDDVPVQDSLGTDILNRYPMPPLIAMQWQNQIPFFVIGGQTAGIRMHQHSPTWVALHAGSKRWFASPGINCSHCGEEGYCSHADRRCSGGHSIPDPTNRPDHPPPEGNGDSVSPESNGGIIKAGIEIRKGETSPQDAFVKAGFLSCDQAAGEVILLPDRWWHATFDLGAWTVGTGSQRGDVVDGTADYMQELFALVRRGSFQRELDGDPETAEEKLHQVLHESVRLEQEDVLQTILQQPGKSAHLVKLPWLATSAAMNGFVGVLQTLLEHGAPVPGAAWLLQAVPPEHGEVRARLSDWIAKQRGAEWRKELASEGEL